MASSYTRVLLQAGLFFRPFVADGTRGTIADASSLRFLLEEMLAHSAVEVGITSTSPLGEAVDTLPVVFRKRVKTLDSDGRVRQICDALFGEIAEELDLSLGGNGVGMRSPPTQLQGDAASLYLELYPFLLAIEHEMEVEIDVPSWADRADAIRHELRNPRGRAILSIVAGIARTYAPVTAESLVIRPDAQPQLIEMFEQLMEDEAYRDLSEQNRMFGIPARASYAKKHVARALRSLLLRRGASALLDSGTRAMSTAAHLPALGKDTLSKLLERNFLPPLVSYKPLIHRAERAWRRARPDYIPLPGYESFVATEWD